MYRLKVKTHFDAAHFIKDYPGKCSREHGHRWEVEVVFEGMELDPKNMLVDFQDVKNLLEALIGAHLDHYQLNESLEERNVTAEFLAGWIYQQFPTIGRKVKLVEVTVWESPDCCATYTP